MKRLLPLRLMLALILFSIFSAIAQLNSISLSGKWNFEPDPMDKGITEKWYRRTLTDHIMLPGSMTTNDKGNAIDMKTPWTGWIDSSWYKSPAYAAYRQPGRIKFPFWLQPVKYYKGAAWYQKIIDIPESWTGKQIQFFIERSHWETQVWLNDRKIGLQNSLGTPQLFWLPPDLKPGRYLLTVRIDNRVKDFNVGENSHSISDHTQTNWNGMIGTIKLTARPKCFIENVQVYPDLDKKQIVIKTVVVNLTGKSCNAGLQAIANSINNNAKKLPPLTKNIVLKNDTTIVEISYPMGQRPLLWDEFHPNLYQLKIALRTPSGADDTALKFGMRKFAVAQRQLLINGNQTFLRGTLECAIFPKTGFPPTDLASWKRIFGIARSYGLNHMRFHSWTPPEAAFNAADEVGFYLQIECSSWANQDSRIGSGDPLDQWIYEESTRVVRAFGNHPSFVMMAYGNEPAGPSHTAYLRKFVLNWKSKDPRRLYTTASGWPVIDESDFNNTPDPRIQAWGQGLKSVINGQPPRTDYDWTTIISKWKQPTISHEIGQWCVYPDLKEISKYTGVLKAKNFEIFRDRLQEHHMLKLADSFLMASGKLQSLCYKADIEAALRTPGFGGFQLLDLHDFPGQGTALVGVLDPFWNNKGYISSEQYSQFCNAVVPLARFPKMIYLNNETLIVPVEVAQYSGKSIKRTTPYWTIRDAKNRIWFKGTFKTRYIPLGNHIVLGNIVQSLKSIKKAERLTVSLRVGNYHNEWDIFIYPAKLPENPANILVTQQLDRETLAVLKRGGKVLLTLKKGTVKKSAGGDIAVGFSSIFWNTAWTNGQPPHTLGILCNPNHPALGNFPTQYFSNWQWWDAMSHADAIRLDSLSNDLNPIVRLIDDWVTARPIGLIIECKIGEGKLILTGIDLLTDAEKRPEARQLRHSLSQYMAGNFFDPKVTVPLENLQSIMIN